MDSRGWIFLSELPPCHLCTRWRCTRRELGLGQPDLAGQEPDSTIMGNGQYCHLLCLRLDHEHPGRGIYVPALPGFLPLQCLVSNNILLTSTRPLIKPPRAYPQKGKPEAVCQVTNISSGDRLNAHTQTWGEILFFRVKVISYYGRAFATFSWALI